MSHLRAVQDPDNGPWPVFDEKSERRRFKIISSDFTAKIEKDLEEFVNSPGRTVFGIQFSSGRRYHALVEYAE